MADVTIYATSIPNDNGYANGSGNGFFWHDAFHSDPEYVRHCLGSDTSIQERNFEATPGGGNLVTDWFNGGFRALARSIVSVDTSQLAGMVWDSVRFYAAPEGPMQPGYWLDTEPMHLVKATGVSETIRTFADYEIRTFGSNNGVHFDRLAASDSAATLTGVTRDEYAASTSIDTTKLPINRRGWTFFGLLADSDITGVCVNYSNVNHFWGPEEAIKPYLLFANVRPAPKSASLDPFTLGGM